MTGAFPGNSPRWAPSRKETGRTSDAMGTSARSCSACATTRRSSKIGPAILPRRRPYNRCERRSIA